MPWLDYHFYDDQPERRHLDALVANVVLGQFIDKHCGSALWRFHRRSSKTLRRFSFIMRADQATIDACKAAIAAEAELLKDLGLTHADKTRDNPDYNSDNIAAGADKDWPVEIQRTWIHYAQGFSRSWLELIREVALSEPSPKTENALQDQIDHYQSIHNRVDEYWKEGGSHVYLHHVHAMFGYAQPFQATLGVWLWDVR